MTKWTADDMPGLQGRVAIVTGANSGLGLETTRALVAKGAHVIMASRNFEKARLARAEIEKTIPLASLELLPLDLASLTSVREFAATFLSKYDHLDLLFNNAGVMAIPRSETEEGFEMQFGTNYLGPFALTGLLLPLLLATPQSRVITTSSIARRMGKVKLNDLNRTRSYARWEAYGQSKLADLLFAFELQSRLTAAHAQTISVAAHPGYSNTNLQNASTTASGSALERIGFLALTFLGQSAYMGALPQLYAGTSADIHGGELVGPGGLGGVRGYPKIETKAQGEYNKLTATRLWDTSVELTGVDYASLLSPAQSSATDKV